MVRNWIEELSKYADDHTSSEGDLLRELERKTYLSALSPQMLSGKLQGRLLSMLSKLVQPNFVLDIGTFTGYSCISLLDGFGEDGLMYTIDVNDDYEHIRSEFFNRHPKRGQIKQLLGNAIDIIPTLDVEAWDIVFIDANKQAYLDYYQLVKNKIRKGGLLIIDNVLWSGKVLDSNKDLDTKIIDDLNKLIVNEGLFETVLMPVRDGISISIKK